MPSTLSIEFQIQMKQDRRCFTCTKKCHGEICKVYNVKDDWKMAWNCDGKEGEDDLNNSDNLLIEWVTTEGNYSKFSNGKTGMGGSRKKDVGNQIVDMINNNSMRKIHTGKQVQSKSRILRKVSKSHMSFLLQKQVRGSWNRARVPSVKPSQGCVPTTMIYLMS